MTGVRGGTAISVGKMGKHPRRLLVQGQSHESRRTCPPFSGYHPQRWWGHWGRDYRDLTHGEVVGVRWYLFTRATYIISVLARGARGTTGTHGTLEETGREDVRMARIRKREGEG